MKYWNSIEIGEILGWLKISELSRTASTNRLFRDIIKQHAFIWKNLCHNYGLLVIDNITSRSILCPQWIQIFHKIFGTESQYKLRSFHWTSAVNDSLLHSLSIMTSFTNHTDKGCKYAIEILPNQTSTRIIICGDIFVCSIEQQSNGVWLFIIRLEDRNRCLPNCNCMYRGRMVFYMYTHEFHAEITGCFSTKILPSHIIEQTPTQILLYVHAIKGFRADDEEYWVYT